LAEAWVDKMGVIDFDGIVLNEEEEEEECNIVS
jgi:hypothetical protein